MEKRHQYNLLLEWKGNTGSGTSAYRSYSRNHNIAIHNRALIAGSSDPCFLGDPRLHNPEDLLVSSVAACHMLWYLSLCAENRIVVVQYTDRPMGIMSEKKDGSGNFTEVILHPEVVVTNGHMIDMAMVLHREANKMCFIAASVNFPIHHHPVITVPHGIL